MEERHLDREVITIWRQRAIIVNVVFWLVITAIPVCTALFDWPRFFYWAAAILGGLNVIHLILFVFVFPSIRYRTFFYAIRREDLLIQEGIFVISQIVIPFTRVQNVETEQGPLLHKRHLTSVSVTTAADTKEIPALAEQDALNLRDQISELIKENAIHEV
ncbi:hypothetical protein EWH99_10165 [Sporolactobacillus sp. THM7-7]|nr:hypothetical protein EWH99_10165 [Sporolactobacillus sp. THM7-7]